MSRGGGDKKQGGKTKFSGISAIHETDSRKQGALH